MQKITADERSSHLAVKVGLLSGLVLAFLLIVGCPAGDAENTPKNVDNPAPVNRPKVDPGPPAN